jgi:outer membrane receptor for ferrienterochelin and colicin
LDALLFNTRFYFDRSRFENFKIEGAVAWWSATGYSLTNYETLTAGTELQINYRFLNNHNIIAGLQVEYFKIYDYEYLTTYEKPFDADWSNDYLWGTGLNVANDRGYLANWHNLPFNQNNSRNIIGFFLQDEWTITDNFISTLGFRFDRYNDFGSTLNPKIGLVFNPYENIFIKGAFATAFRAPTFQELYDKTQISIKNGSLGNPNLEAEKIQTAEIGLEYKRNNNLMFRLNAFNNKIEDNIFPQNVNKLEGASSEYDVYENINGIDIYGLETEISFNKDIYNYLTFNSSWFSATNKGGYIVTVDQTGPVHTDYESNMFEVPQFRYNFIFNFDRSLFGLFNHNIFNTNFVLNATYSFASERYNNMLDIVPATGNTYTNTGGRRWKIDEYHLVNLAVSTTDNLSHNVNLKFSIYNLTDEKMYDNYYDVIKVNYTLKDYTLDKVFPLQGRTFSFSVDYKF